MNRQTKQQGFTLIELMIAMVLGLILMAAVLTLFTSILNSNTEMVKRFQLQRELRATMGLMVRDLRRAGYNAAASPLRGYTNPFGLAKAKSHKVLFSYDLDNDGTLESSDCFGYKYDGAAGAIQILDKASVNDDTCTAQQWRPVATTNLIDIRELTFKVFTKPAGDIRIRRIKITLKGRLRKAHGISSTITRNVLVRNDAVSNS